MLDWLGALVGKALGQKDEEQSRNYEQQQLDQLTGLNAPTLERVQAEQMGRSGLNDYHADPRFKQAQLDAINAYGQVGREGYTGADRAAMDEAQRDVASQERGQREALLQRADMQGGLSSGNALGASLVAQQGQADRAGAAGNRVVLAGRQRALDAYGKAADLASGARGQEFGEASRLAQANDDIARFNTGQRSQAGYYNAGLGQQDFNNRAGVAQMKSGAYGQAANRAHQRADEWSNMGKSVGQGFDANIQAGMGLMTGLPSGGSMGAAGGGAPQQGPYPGGYGPPEDEQWRNPWGQR